MNEQQQQTPETEAEWDARYAKRELKKNADYVLRNMSDVAGRLRRTAEEVDRIVDRVGTAIDDEERRRYQSILEQAMQVQQEVLNATSNMRFDLIVKYAAAVDRGLATR